MDEPKQRHGRPGREPRPGERVGLGLRVTPKTKNRLDSIAAENGRSQSQEGEMRIESTFTSEDSITAAFALAFGGPRNAAVLQLLGRIIAEASRWEEISGEGDWLDNHNEFAAVQRALHDALARLAPPQHGPREDDHIAENAWRYQRPALLLELTLTGKGPNGPHWTKDAIAKLGPDIAQRLAPPDPAPPPAEKRRAA